MSKSSRCDEHVQMQALMAEAQASAAKAAAEREKEAAQRALKAKNLPMMLRGAKLNITAQPPVKGNALQEAAAKAPPPPQSSTPKAADGANGLGRSGETWLQLSTGMLPRVPLSMEQYLKLLQIATGSRLPARIVQRIALQA